VNPAKVEVVIFTRRRKLGPLPDLNLFGHILGNKSQVKYLGVILDSRLNWNDHLAVKTGKARNALWACKRVFDTTWGLQPRILRWIYCAVVRPMMNIKTDCLVRSYGYSQVTSLIGHGSKTCLRLYYKCNENCSNKDTGTAMWARVAAPVYTKRRRQGSPQTGRSQYADYRLS